MMPKAVQSMMERLKSPLPRKPTQEEMDSFMKDFLESPHGAMIQMPPGWGLAILERADQGFENGDGI